MRNRRAQQAAVVLRRQMTDAERHLWSRIRARQLHGFKFRRQYPIGPFVADFACLEAHLIIEVDGSQHAERSHADGQRSAFLAHRGFRVLRFWNNEVLAQTDGVLEQIVAALEAAASAPPS